MQTLVNSREMKECDGNTIRHFHMPSLVLMERAAVSVYEEIRSRGIDASKTLVACGLGNNGGDGLAVARLLHQSGCDVTILLDWNEKKASEETKHQFDIVQKYGIPVTAELPRQDYTLVVDALFGIGLSREVTGRLREWIEALNACSGFKLAVDIPSGISGDNGQILGCGFLADLTVTFAYAKTGLLLYPGLEYAGTVVVTDIGIDENSWLGKQPGTYALEKSDLSRMPGRLPCSNKGTYGHVLVIAGSRNMSGAAFFSGKAAAVTGCGLVKIFTHADNRVILQQQFPEAILETWREEELETDGLLAPSLDGQAAEAQVHPGTSSPVSDFYAKQVHSGTSLPMHTFYEKLERNLRWADAVVVGPGLGTNAAARRLLEEVLKLAASPVIMDADALNLISQNPGLLEGFLGKAIVTPHLGEMERLTGQNVQEIRRNIVDIARKYAKEHNVICVCKDARTVTALPEGRAYINTSGNQGMATAGAGDVLTGVLAGLVAQGMEPKDAAPFGVFLHGLAGDAIREETGCYGMLATDIIEGVRRVTKELGR